MKVAETRAFAPLMVSETSRNLRRVFRLSEMLKAQAPKKPRLQAAARARHRRRHDGRRHRRLVRRLRHGGDAAGRRAPSRSPRASPRRGKLFARKFKTKAQRDAAKARLIADPKGDNIGRADVVIEAIVEKLEIKQNLFKSIEGEAEARRGAGDQHLLDHDREDRRAAGRSGPPDRHPLLQSRGADAAGRGRSAARRAREEEVGKGCVFVAAIDKFPLIVKSSPGFLVNRVLAPYMMAAPCSASSSGEAKEKIDEAARTFGMPMGPIELADTVGLDVCAHVGKILKLGAGRRHQARPDGGGRQARQEVGRGLLRLEGRQAGEDRARDSPTTSSSWSGSGASWSIR